METHCVQSPSIVRMRVPFCHIFHVGTHWRLNVSSLSFSSAPPQSKLANRIGEEAYCEREGGRRLLISCV